MHHNVSNSGFPSLQLSCSKLKLPIPKAWRHFSIDDRTVKSWHVMTLGLWTIKRAMYVMIVMVMASFTLNLLIRWDVISAIDKNQCTHSIIASLNMPRARASAWWRSLTGWVLQVDPKPCIFKSIRLIQQKSPFTKAYKIWALAINMHHLNQTEVTSCVKGVLAFRISKKKHHAKIKTFGASKFSSEAANGGGTGWHG